MRRHASAARLMGGRDCRGDDCSQADDPLAAVSHHELFAQGVVVQFMSFESRVKEPMIPVGVDLI